ncbi:MAG: gliding motility-associated C-terminal domain-containing protein [Lentimicrobiaceae bacterium]|nr:gliding motility-associated C-terminal domain-containing protein [Lentimicrobiaceae bacterium]
MKVTGLLLLLFGFYHAFSQDNVTRIDSATVCPNTIIYLPVSITELQNVDSISLVLNFDTQTAVFADYRQINALLKTGFYEFTPLPDGVRFSWSSSAPVSFTNARLFELGLKSGNTSGKLMWNPGLSTFRQAGGGVISSSYEDAGLNILPELRVVLEEIDATCANSCEANIAAYASGGLRPYEFLWNGTTSVFDSINAGACSGINNLRITDDNGCVLDTNYVVSQLPSTNVDVDFNPDTVYIQNPVVRFSFTEDPDIVEWLWDFGDGTQASRERSPTHIYTTAAMPNLENYRVNLRVVNAQGCDTLITKLIPVREAEIFIPNVFTPNGDNTNDLFCIAKKNDGGSTSGSNYIPINQEIIRMELVVLDRWGRRVYSNENYRNNWDGGGLPDGTYYYKLDIFGYFRTDSYKGAVTILRGLRN